MAKLGGKFAVRYKTPVGPVTMRVFAKTESAAITKATKGSDLLRRSTVTSVRKVLTKPQAKALLKKRK